MLIHIKINLLPPCFYLLLEIHVFKCHQEAQMALFLLTLLKKGFPLFSVFNLKNQVIISISTFCIHVLFLGHLNCRYENWALFLKVT